jgi:hypothetical protein
MLAVMVLACVAETADGKLKPSEHETPAEIGARLGYP